MEREEEKAHMKMETGADVVFRWDSGADEMVGRIDIRDIHGAGAEIGIGMRRMGLVLIRIGLKLLFGSRKDAEEWEAAWDGHDGSDPEGD